MFIKLIRKIKFNYTPISIRSMWRYKLTAHTLFLTKLE